MRCEVQRRLLRLLRLLQHSRCQSRQSQAWRRANGRRRRPRRRRRLPKFRQSRFRSLTTRPSCRRSWQAERGQPICLSDLLSPLLRLQLLYQRYQPALIGCAMLQCDGAISRGAEGAGEGSQQGSGRGSGAAQGAPPHRPGEEAAKGAEAGSRPQAGLDSSPGQSYELTTKFQARLNCLAVAHLRLA